MCNGLSNQFITVEFYGISIFVINIIPKRLELLLVEVIIQRVFLNLRLMTVGNHIIKCVLIEDALNEGMYTICNFFTAFRNRGKSIIGEICTILVGYMIIVIDVVVFDQVTINIAALLIGYCNIATTDIDGFTDEVFCSCFGWAIIKVFTDSFLEIFHKIFIPIRSNYCELINFLYLAAKCIVVLALAVLIYAKAKTTANFLTLLCRRAATML